MACARAGIHLVHTPAYRPQGRGKVAQFFRTVRDPFLSRNQAKTLEELNTDFARWLSGYNQRIHSSLECSPLKKRLSIPNVCKPVPETTDLEALFRMQRRCRVYKDGTIRLKNKAFEVPGVVPFSRVNAYYMPWDLSRVYYGQAMQLAREVDLSANAHRFDHPGGGR